ncbi:MAG: zinc ribbon domain-containing protein [Clostridiaceae bacterium]|nr:zinc ribbon domain-containing protein [Clostridiaceae bacterium]
MKNCINCNAEIADNAVFCPKCGHDQRLAPEVAGQEVGGYAQNQQQPYQAYQAPAPQQQAAPYQSQPGTYPPQGAYPPPYQQGPPSQLAIYGKRYFGWLLSGILGTKEPMHLLFAAIVPFLTTLIYTLSNAPFYAWHAGGFFLVWFFAIVFVAAIPVLAWALKTFLLKESVKITNVISEYCSYFNIILPFSLFAMIFALAIRGISPANFFYALYQGTLLFSLLAGVATIFSKPGKEKNNWLSLLAMGFLFILFTFILNTIGYAALRWALGW